MKKIVRGIALILCAALLMSCTSKEKKAEALVKAHLNTVLNDFNSYEPVSTKLDTLYDVPQFNPVVIEKAKQLIASEVQRDKYKKDADRAHERAMIWASPLSSYGATQYKSETAKHLGLSMAMMEEIIKEEELEKEIVELSQAMDFKKQIGWMITHQFRSNNLNGSPILQDCLCLADLDLKTVQQFFYGNDTDTQEAIMRIIGTVQNPLSLEEYDERIKKSQEILDNLKKESE